MTSKYYFIWMMPFVVYASGVVADTDFPPGFQDYFAPETKVVDIAIAGDMNGASVKGEATFDSFKAFAQPDSFIALDSYLSSQGLTEDIIAGVHKSLVNGVVANPGCQSSFESCVLPTTADEQIRYLFDYEQSLIKLFVAPELLRHSVVSGYHSPIQRDMGLINTSRLDVNYDFLDTPTFSIDNNSMLGLPAGYLIADTQYQSSDSQFEVFSSSYNLDFRGNRFQIGKIQSSYLALNTTDFLFNDANYDAYSASWSSSSNLVKRNTASTQSISFFAPQAGLLEVSKGERILFSRTVSQGRQEISYDELPRGAYTLTLKLKIGNQVAFEDNRLIVNNADFALQTGHWDFSYSVGVFDEDDSVDDTLDGSHLTNKWYWKASQTYRLFDSTLLGFSMMGGDDSVYALSGGKYIYSDGKDLSVTLGYFSNGDIYHSSNLNLLPLNLSWSRLKRKQYRGVGLSSYLYGQSSYDKISASIGGTVLGGSSYLNYSLFNFSSDMSDSSSQSITGSWSHDLLGGSLSLNTTYSISSGSEDDIQLGLVWSRGLTDSTSYNLSMYADKHGFSNATNGINHNLDIHGWHISNSIRSQFERDDIVDIDYSLSVNGANNYIDSQIYSYFDNHGEKTTSLSLSNTQVITPSGIQFTSSQSETYLSLGVNGHYNSNKDHVFFNIKNRGNGYAIRDKLNQQNMLVPLTTYNDIQVKLDAESDLVSLSNSTDYFFTLPGGVYRLNTDIERLKSKIYIMSDINEDPIRDLQCRGDGCVLVEPLTNDGVFRVNYKDGERYELFSAKNLCVSPLVESDTQYVPGYCLPGIENDSSLFASEEESIEPKDGPGRVLFYLGKFDSKDAVDKVLAKLGSVNIDARIIEIEPDLYVYVEDVNNQLSLNQKSILNELNALVLPQPNNIKYLSSNELNYDF